ncbi:hypothetical protein [Stappia indica]|uniref:hypothetical protein n=1 Tax=Stappia indica TaxID=538381 RepID=UPI001143C001|nr:hypothetical protein [Stappia indica]
MYSVVNASLRLSPKHLSEAQIKCLFRELCLHLADEGRLEDTLFEGMTVRVLGRLIDAASDFLQAENVIRIQRKLAFGSAPAGLAEFWDTIAEHIKSHGSGSVILGLGGRYDHWTCIGSISETRISLVDSDGLHHLHRKNCTVAEERGGRHHVLWPTQTYLLNAAP